MRIYFCSNKNEVLMTNHIPNIAITNDGIRFIKQAPLTRGTSGNRGITVFPDIVPPIPEGRIIALDVNF